MPRGARHTSRAGLHVLLGGLRAAVAPALHAAVEQRLLDDRPVSRVLLLRQDSTGRAKRRRPATIGVAAERLRAGRRATRGAVLIHRLLVCPSLLPRPRTRPR